MDVDSSDWADAKVAKRQAFNRISEARSQGDWLKAWQAWSSTLQMLRQQVRHQVPPAEPDLEFELQSEQSVLWYHTEAVSVSIAA
jgi:hypothetical protein